MGNKTLNRFASMMADSNYWSGSLSFASPEADFIANETRNRLLKHMNTPTDEKDRSILVYSLSFAQAESDYTSLLLTEGIRTQLENVISPTSHVEIDEKDQSTLVYSLSFAQAESDYCSLPIVEEMKTDSTSQIPLPTTLPEALLPSTEARVITEAIAPFKITSVSSAWEHLCGYNRYQCYGKTLKMIQGPETNMDVVCEMMERLSRGENADGVLINYKNDGTKFKNHLRVGPIYGDIDGRISNEVTHFIGILEEIQEVSENKKVHM